MGVLVQFAKVLDDPESLAFFFGMQKMGELWRVNLTS
jgi:hypothetical protein